jgi:hypothetical protein
MKKKKEARIDLDLPWFTLHSLAAIPVGGALSVLVTGAVETFIENAPDRQNHLIGLLDWYVPYVCILGFISGFAVNRKTLNLAACYVWLAGVAWLGLGIWDSIHRYDPRFYQGCSALENVGNAFFILNGRKCGGGSSTLAGALFTMPALNSAAYSAGAWVALRRKQRDD